MRQPDRLENPVTVRLSCRFRGESSRQKSRMSLKRARLQTSACRQLAVPAQNRVCRGDGRHLRQRGTSKLVSEHSQTLPFLITELQASSARVRPQHSILFPQERDHAVLLAHDPTAQSVTNNWNGDTAGSYVSPRSIQFWASTGVSFVGSLTVFVCRSSMGCPNPENHSAALAGRSFAWRTSFRIATSSNMEPLR